MLLPGHVIVLSGTSFSGGLYLGIETGRVLGGLGGDELGLGSLY